MPLKVDQILAHYQAGPDVTDVDEPCPAYLDGDINMDCSVDLLDLALLAGIDYSYNKDNRLIG